MKKTLLILGLSLILVSCADTTTIRVCKLQKQPFTISYQLHGHNNKIDTIYRTVTIDTRIFTDDSSLDSYIASLDNLEINGNELYTYKVYTLTSNTYYDVSKTIDYFTALGYECY